MPADCPTCGGSGVLMAFLGGPVMEVAGPCPGCGGSGEAVMPMTKPQLESLRGRIADALEDMRGDLFTDAMRLTLVARLPGNSECEVLVTDDDLGEVAAVVERSRRRRIVGEKVEAAVVNFRGIPGRPDFITLGVIETPGGPETSYPVSANEPGSEVTITDHAGDVHKKVDAAGLLAWLITADAVKVTLWPRLDRYGVATKADFWTVGSVACSPTGTSS